MDIKKPVNYLSFLILCVILLISCFPQKTHSETPSFVITSALPTSTPSVVNVAQTLMADPQSMQDCKTVSSQIRNGQMDYRKIIPGQTMSQKVEELLGKPEEVSTSKGEKWFYDGYLISFRNKMVDSIYVDNDPKILVQLNTIITNNGCPDLIMALDIKEEPTGGYEATQIIYLELGVEYFFGAFPISLSSIPEFASFAEHQTLEKYFQKSGLTNLSPAAGIPVSWDQAVQ